MNTRDHLNDGQTNAAKFDSDKFITTFLHFICEIGSRFIRSALSDRVKIFNGFRNQTIFGLRLFRLCQKGKRTSSFFAGFHQTGEEEQPTAVGEG